jgi:uncharacterized protein YecT (DUF1311 family)
MDRLPVVAVIAVLLLLLLGGSDPTEGKTVKDAEDVGAICERYKNYSPGRNAVPTDEDRKRFSSEKSCGFIEESAGKRKQLDELRRCCLVKGDCNRELAMLFANGWGVARDYETATYFLCRDRESAEAEREGMLSHIREMRKSKRPEDLRYCDHVTGGAGQVYCMQLESDRKEEDWTKRLEVLKKKLDKDAVLRLDALEKAAREFAEEEAGFLADEDRGGTGYPAEAAAEQLAAFEAFVSRLERLVKKRAAAANADDPKRADLDLNRAYKAAQKMPRIHCDEEDKSGCDALRTAQRAWLKYRDEWRAFYLLLWKGAAAPEVLQREIETILTKDRTEQFKKLLSGSRTK